MYKNITYRKQPNGVSSQYVTTYENVYTHITIMTIKNNKHTKLSSKQSYITTKILDKVQQN